MGLNPSRLSFKEYNAIHKSILYRSSLALSIFLKESEVDFGQVTGMNHFERSALHLAVETRSFDLVEMLVNDDRCPLSAIDMRDQTPLEMAIELKEYDIAKLIEDKIEAQRPILDTRTYLVKQ